MKELRTGLHLLAGMDIQKKGVQHVKPGVIRALRMDAWQLVMNFARDGNIANMARPRGKLMPGHRKTVVGSLVAGVVSSEFRRDVMPEVGFNREVHGLTQVLGIVDLMKATREILE